MSELPSGWSIVPLEVVSEKVTDGTHKTPNYVESGVRFISIKNIRAYKPIDWDAYERYITREEHEELIKRCNPEKGDIVFPRIGTLGFAKIVDWDVEFSLFVGLGLVKPDRYLIEPKYLEHYMNSPFVAEYSKVKATGTGRMTLALAESKRLPVLLPPLVEQTRIAHKLDELLAQIDTLKARIDGIPALLKRFRQSVLAAAVSGRLTEEWRAQTDTELSVECSEDFAWPTVRLGEVARDFSYGSSAKSQPIGSIPVLRMGNIQGGGLVWGDLVFSSDQKEIEKYALKPGDVLFNRTNSPELVGKTAIYKGEQPAIYAGYLIRIRCSEHLSPDFLNYCLNSPQGRHYCWQVKTDGVSQSNINAKKLADFRLGLPSIEEQTEIVYRVEQLFAFADQLEAKVASAKSRIDRLTHSILAKAFRGELVPQDPSDEPASVLLERIQAQRAAAPKAKRGRKTSA